MFKSWCSCIWSLSEHHSSSKCCSVLASPGSLGTNEFPSSTNPSFSSILPHWPSRVLSTIAWSDAVWNWLPTMRIRPSRSPFRIRSLSNALIWMLRLKFSNLLFAIITLFAHGDIQMAVPGPSFRFCSCFRNTQFLISKFLPLDTLSAYRLTSILQFL